MKRFVFYAIALSAFLFLNCSDFKDLTFPESISVKTSASFEAPLGESSIALLEKFGIDMIQDAIDENLPTDEDDNSNPVVYDYNPEEKDSSTITYIIDYPVLKYNLSLTDNDGKEIDLDVNEIPIGPKSVETPDFNTIISNKLEIPEKTLSIPELGDKVEIDEISKNYPGFSPSIAITIEKPDFETISFYTGNLNIKIEPQNPANISDDFVLSPSITLYSGDDEIAKSDESDSVEIKKAAETITLKLDGKTLKKDLKIVVSGNISGGVTPTLRTGSTELQYNVNDYKFSVSTSDIELKEITGLNMSNDDLGADGKITFDQSFSLATLNKHLKSAEVKKGTLQIYSELPTGWQGIKLSEDSNFVVTGGLELNNFTDGEEIGTKYILNKTANLENCKIEPQTEVSTTGSYICISLDDARIIFEKGKKAELSINGICTITELGEVIIDIGELEAIKDTKDTGLNFSTLLDIGEQSDLLKNIEFTGIEAYFFVTQPTENDCLNSLAITGTVTAKYNDKDENPKTRNLVDIPSDSDEPIRIKPATITLASLADENNMITEDTVFQDKGADSLYSFKLEDEAMTGLLNDLPDGLAFDYDLAIQTSSQDGTVKLTQNEIDLVKSKAQISISLAIKIPLKIKLNDVSDGRTDGKITIPDVQALAKDKDSDDKPEDLLNRDKADDSEDWLKYSEAIKSFYLTYTVDNNIFLNEEEYDWPENDESKTTYEKDAPLPITITLYAVDAEKNGDELTYKKDENGNYVRKPYFYDKDGNPTSERALETSKGSHTLHFSKDEINAILKDYPFIPKIKVEVPAHGKTQYVPRNGAFGVSGTFHISFDGNESIKVWGK